MQFPSTTLGAPGRARIPIATIVRRLAVIGALALTAVGLSVPAASAGESEWITTKRGFVEFRDHGEILVAEDKRRDGYGVRARVTWYGDGGGQAVVTDAGAGGKSATKNLRIRERITVQIELCYTIDDSDVKCSIPQSAVA